MCSIFLGKSVSELLAVLLTNQCYGLVQGKLRTNVQTRVQSIQMGLFSWKVPIDPVNFFYLSIIVERFTMYNLVVLYLWKYVYWNIKTFLGQLLSLYIERKKIRVAVNLFEPESGRSPTGSETLLLTGYIVATKVLYAHEVLSVSYIVIVWWKLDKTSWTVSM